MMPHKAVMIEDHGDHAVLGYTLTAAGGTATYILSNAEIDFADLQRMVDSLDKLLAAPVEPPPTVEKVGDAIITVSYNTHLWVQLGFVAVALTKEEAQAVVNTLRYYLNTKVVTEDNASDEIKELKRSYSQPSGS